MLDERHTALIQSVVNVVIQSAESAEFLAEMEDAIHFALFVNEAATALGDTDLAVVASATGVGLPEVRDFFDANRSMPLSTIQRIIRFVRTLPEEETDA